MKYKIYIGIMALALLSMLVLSGCNLGKTRCSSYVDCRANERCVGYQDARGEWCEKVISITPPNDGKICTFGIVECDTWDDRFCADNLENLKQNHPDWNCHLQ